jgi:hypothetical protein
MDVVRPYPRTGAGGWQKINHGAVNWSAVLRRHQEIEPAG